jgi:pimeloyl-ACP methyl ester carboxylesterase
MTPDGVLGSVTVDGEGRTLVLLHGGPGLVDYMALLDAETVGWRRVRYQQRGHSPSAISGPFTFLALQWPGYFADPEHAAPPPTGLLLNLTCNGETMASVFGELQSGFADRLVGCELPVELVVGESSPIPFAVSEQTAALLPKSQIAIIPDAGHLPWHEQPGCVRAALARL